jgi:hypothetical protein
MERVNFFMFLQQEFFMMKRMTSLVAVAGVLTVALPSFAGDRRTQDALGSNGARVVYVPEKKEAVLGHRFVDGMAAGAVLGRATSFAVHHFLGCERDASVAAALVVTAVAGLATHPKHLGTSFEGVQNYLQYGIGVFAGGLLTLLPPSWRPDFAKKAAAAARGAGASAPAA